MTKKFFPVVRSVWTGLVLFTFSVFMICGCSKKQKAANNTAQKVVRINYQTGTLCALLFTLQ